MQAAEDVPALMAELRINKSAVSRRKIRFLIQKDAEPPSPASLPVGLILERGRAEIQFRTLEQFAATLMQIAQWLDADPDGFAQEYEPTTERAITASPGGEAENLLADLKRLEAEKTAGHTR